MKKIIEQGKGFVRVKTVDEKKSFNKKSLEERVAELEKRFETLEKKKK